MDKGIIDLIPAAVGAVRAAVEKKIRLFGSDGKAMPERMDKDMIARYIADEVKKELERCGRIK